MHEHVRYVVIGAGIHGLVPTGTTGEFMVLDPQEYRRVISLPIFPGMTDEDVNDVIGAMRKVVAHYRR